MGWSWTALYYHLRWQKWGFRTSSEPYWPVCSGKDLGSSPKYQLSSSSLMNVVKHWSTTTNRLSDGGTSKTWSSKISHQISEATPSHKVADFQIQHLGRSAGSLRRSTCRHSIPQLPWRRGYPIWILHSTALCQQSGILGASEMANWGHPRYSTRCFGISLQHYNLQARWLIDYQPRKPSSFRIQ